MALLAGTISWNMLFVLNILERGQTVIDVIQENSDKYQEFQLETSLWQLPQVNKIKFLYHGVARFK